MPACADGVHRGASSDRSEDGVSAVESLVESLVERSSGVDNTRRLSSGSGSSAYRVAITIVVAMPATSAANTSALNQTKGCRYQRTAEFASAFDPDFTLSIGINPRRH